MNRQPRYCFIAGLHRSGTTLLARLLGAHPDIAALTAPHVPENEGVYLQGAIPHTALHGVPGAFAFDPAQHLTEYSPYNTAAIAERMTRDWSPWFMSDARWRLEKSPVNLLRMRLYQQLFPMAHFIVITRHPWAAARATAKWSRLSIEDLVGHWSHAHSIALSDLSYLHCALVIRYEDLVADPQTTLARATEFLGLPPLRDAVSLRNGNRDYASEWHQRPPEPALRLGYTANILGPHNPLPSDLTVRHVFRSIREQVLASSAAQKEVAPDGR